MLIFPGCIANLGFFFRKKEKKTAFNTDPPPLPQRIQEENLETRHKRSICIRDLNADIIQWICICDFFQLYVYNVCIKKYEYHTSNDYNLFLNATHGKHVCVGDATRVVSVVSTISPSLQVSWAIEALIERHPAIPAGIQICTFSKREVSEALDFTEGWWFTPPKFNLAPEKSRLKNEFPFGMAYFQGPGSIVWWI